MVVNNPLIRPYSWGSGIEGVGPLESHDCNHFLVSSLGPLKPASTHLQWRGHTSKPSLNPANLKHILSTANCFWALICEMSIYRILFLIKCRLLQKATNIEIYTELHHGTWNKCPNIIHKQKIPSFWNHHFSCFICFTFMPLRPLPNSCFPRKVLLIQSTIYNYIYIP